MALQKQSLPLPFGQGVETKTDPKQLPPGKMRELRNAVFTAGNLLQKRNGYGQLTQINDPTVNTITTFRDGLTAIGESLHAYSPDNDTWYNKGGLSPIQTTVQPMVRSSSAQSAQDLAIDAEGLACVTWEDSDGNAKYQVIDRQSGNIVVPMTNLEATAAKPRVFVLGRFFVITYLVTVGPATHLRFMALPRLTPETPAAPVDIATNASSLTAAYDGHVANNGLYLAWDSAVIGGTVVIGWIDSTLLVRTPNTSTYATYEADYISVTSDLSTPTPTIWVTIHSSSSNIGYTAAVASNTLAQILAPTALGGAAPLLNGLTSVASNGLLTVLFQTENVYPTTAVRSDFVSLITCTQGGTVSASSVVARSVALASKAFAINDRIMFMAAYGGSLQPTYFLIDSLGVVLAKLAYSNAGGYPTTDVLPQANVDGSTVHIGYMYKATLTPVNKSQGVTTVAGIYAQTGINLISWGVNSEPSRSVEIGSNLNLTGGFLWAYDGVMPVEQGFHLFPEDILAVEDTGGSMAAQQYYYQVTYEWTDAQGNLHRSAPSIPTGVLVASGSASVDLQIPTLRLTEKVANNLVRIVIYRWSVAQQVYYQVTSITSPLLNDPTVDSVAYSDTQADASILGNQILYTTGSVVENIAAPAAVDFTLFKSRLVMIDAENRNQLWFSKQCIQNTPVEMSDLFTIFVAPTTAAQGSTGECSALSTMDDKLIIFKPNAAYYITGNGPDNTGANNDFSEPIFIAASVGCTNPKSIVLTPNGLIFQSDKGIWLLGRDLNTTYVGAPVEAYNSAEVLSAIVIPGTTQVRFTLNNGLTLMYDYFFSQWGVFSNVPAISSTLYENLHTYVNSLGAIYQETPGSYLDGSSPVLMSFTTAWFNLAGLQGLERAYFFYLLGTYLSPHKLSIGVAYDYNPAIAQQMLAEPDNYSPVYGSAPGPYGSETPYGGIDSVEQFRVFLSRQKLQAFQVTLTEVFDPSLGVPAGAGFTMSGINLVVGTKKGYATLKPSKSVG
jgi:hypothetical protein